MKLLLAACLCLAPAFAQSSWDWRDEVRAARIHAREARAEAYRAARSARLEAERSTRELRAGMLRQAARARAEARVAREEARRALRNARRDRDWYF